MKTEATVEVLVCPSEIKSRGSAKVLTAQMSGKETRRTQSNLCQLRISIIFRLILSLEEGWNCVLSCLRATVSLCRAYILVRSHLRSILVNVTNYFLDREIDNKILYLP